MRLKRIGVLSLAKIAGLFGVIYGLLLGILISIVVSAIGSVPGAAQQLGAMVQLGYSSLIIFPILYGVIYFVVGIVTAAIYNFLAGKIGGVEVELKR